MVDYLSPKRRRTLGPTTPSHHEHSYDPASEPQGQKARAALRGRLDGNQSSPSDLRFATNSRKRAREEDCDTAVTDSHLSGSEISPDESASQITVAQTSITDPTEGDEEEQDDDELEEEIEEDMEDMEDEEVSPEDKVAEYLARQAELELRKDAIAEVKAKGDWHPDEVYLFERLSLRSFEVVFPAEWKRELPTLPADLFGNDNETTLINNNCRSTHTGKAACQPPFQTLLI